MIRFLTCIFILFFVSGCGPFFGTEVGNPDDSENHSPVPALVDANLLELSVTLCGVIGTCYNASAQGACEFSIRTLSGLTQALGLGAQFENLAQVEDGISEGLISISSENKTTCFQAIDDLECSSETVVQSYDVNQPDDFTHLPMLLSVSNSCTMIFND